jgi:hypothetical protein
LLFLALICLQGCIDQAADLKDATSSIELVPSYGQVSDAEMNFDSEVSSTLFRASGDLMLWGNSTLPYVILNATLCQEGRPVTSARYMLIDVQSNRDYGFEICKNFHLASGEYSCTLEAAGPSGLLSSQTRSCKAEFQEDLPSDAAAENAGREFFPFPAENSARDEDIFSDFTDHEDSSEERDPSGSDSDSVEPEARDDADLGEATTESLVLPAEDEMEGHSQATEDRVQIEESPSLKQNPASEDSESSSHKLVGSTSSNKYHQPDCRYAAKIKPENRVYFSSVEEAEKKKYQPCKSCNPS